MDLKKTRCALVCFVGMLGNLVAVFAQDVTAEEMMQLDKLRSQYEAQGLSLTPEQEARMLQRIRALKAIGAGGNSSPNGASAAGSLPTPKSTESVGGGLLPQLLQKSGAPVSGGATMDASPTAPPVSEADLARRIAAMPAGKPIGTIEYLRDGFQYDGQRFVDPQGRVTTFAVDAFRGVVTYVPNTIGDAPQPVKLAFLGDTVSSEVIGRVARQNGQYRFESLTGKSLSGDLLILLNDGVVVLRDAVGFRYAVGEGVRQIDLPKGWYPTPLQRGNVSTGWILLEKDTSAEKSNPLNLFSNFGKAVGLTEANEYALFNFADGRKIVLDVSSAGKTTSKYSNCRKRSELFNECQTATNYQSVWNADGFKNLSHYYWRMDWQQSIAGPVLVAQEGGLKYINAYDLATGKKVNLLERTLGVAGFDVVLKPGQKVQVQAQMGFEKVVIEDVQAELSSRVPLPGVAPGK